MPTLDDINDLLEEANAKLNEAMHAIRDLPLEPKRDHMHRIGKALSEIYDIQYHVFALKPGLTPRALQGPFDHPEGALNVALRHAHAAEESGNPDLATAILRWVAPRITGEHRKRAEAEISRLAGKRDA
jgi:hypothetical protein